MSLLILTTYKWLAIPRTRTGLSVLFHHITIVFRKQRLVIQNRVLFCFVWGVFFG